MLSERLAMTRPPRTARRVHETKRLIAIHTLGSSNNESNALRVKIKIA